MADQRAQSSTNAVTVPKLPPGTLIDTEVSYRPKIDLSDTEINELRDLCKVIQLRDMPARREEVIRVWEKRLFDRGFQHLIPLRTGGWKLPANGTGYGPNEGSTRSIFETNIYNSYMQIIVSALTREVPKCRMKPIDQDDDADITAAEKAEKLKPHIEKVNKLKSLMADMVRFLWTDGRSVFLTQYMKDGQQFGFMDKELEEEEEKTTPETEAEISKEEEEENAEERATGEGMPKGDEEPDKDTESQGKPGDGEKAAREPRGRQVVTVLGALESKFPIKEDTLATCTYAQVSREIDLQRARAKYPDHADKISASVGGPGGDDVDRLARINTRLGVLDNYQTTDSAAYDVTEQITWFRSAALLEIKNQDVIDSLIEKAGEHGLRVTFCGQEFCEARSISMDEQLTLVHALPGDGMHRPGLGDWLLPIQKVLNNWLELADEYFTRGVPNTWMDNEMFNVETLRNQTNVPGAKHPFDREDGITMDQVIWQEQALQFPQLLWEFIQFFTEELPQLLCGAFPALFGGDQASATDTYGGMLVQRDQALGRIGLPWRNIVEAIGNVMRQAIVCLARNDEEGSVTLDNEESTRIQLEDLAGNFLAEPEVDSNFPATWSEKANRMNLVVQEAATNPLYQKLLDSPRNLDRIKRAIGLEELELPMLEASNKQLGEITELLEGAPEPNPKIDQIDKLIGEMEKAEKDRLAVPVQNGAQPAQPDPDVAARVAQLTQIKSQLPPMVSTVRVRWADDDDTELATCKEFLNSVRGRELANSDDEDEQLAYQNIELHAQEHEAAGKQKKAAAGPPAGGKPPSVSIALKDLPPAEAAAAATMAGIPAKAEDFKAEEAVEAVTKHPGPGGITTGGTNV